MGTLPLDSKRHARRMRPLLSRCLARLRGYDAQLGKLGVPNSRSSAALARTRGGSSASQEPGRVIGVLSPNGGSGSSTLAANLSTVLAGKFGDVAKIRWGLFELAGLARTIHWSGTDAQKEKLAEARAKVLTAITEAKQSLHAALAES